GAPSGTTRSWRRPTSTAWPWSPPGSVTSSIDRARLGLHGAGRGPAPGPEPPSGPPPRGARTLLDQGVTVRQIRRALDALRRLAPTCEAPLAELRVTVRDGEIF